MTVHTSLVILSLTRALAGSVSEAPEESLALQGEFAAPSPWTMDLSLHTERFFAQSRGRHRSRRAPDTQAVAPPATQPTPAQQPPQAQQTPQPAAQPAAQTPAPATGGGATEPLSARPATTDAPPADPAAPEQCDIDCEDARQAQRLARDIMRSRGRVLSTHRAFAIAAWSSMIVTVGLGTIQMVNGDTWFGRGACASNPRAFACEEYSLVQGLHQTFAFVTTGLYTTAGVIAATAPDPENASVGEGGAERRLRLHKTLAWVHGAGMIILPILGILSVNPQIFGITDNEARADFSRATRTIHTFIGYGTLTALTVAGILEF